MFGRQNIQWRKLDNTAKIFPAVSNRKDTRVFRFYCECVDSVEGDALQQAVTVTLKKYPLFQCVLRKGLFWFYMEQSSIPPTVYEESDPPCMTLYHRDQKNLLFQVTYYKNRINLEVFHALTDGTGAIEFLRELVKQYLLLRYPEAQLPDIPLTEQDMTLQDQETDSFSKYYNKHPLKKAEKTLNSYQLSGARTDYGEMNITEGVVSCKALLKKAKEYGVSITVLLTSALLWAIYEEMPLLWKKRPVTLMVPVNLRKHFPSASMLNFWGWIEPNYRFNKDCTLEDVISHVQEYFKRELTKEGLEVRVSQFMKLERNPLIRLFPLEIKNLAMQLTVQLERAEVTAVYSNLGAIRLPQEYSCYLRRFGAFTSTPKIELCTCSFEDDFVISITSGFQSLNVERNFFRILKSLELDADLLEGQFPEQKKPAERGHRFIQWLSFVCLAGICGCGAVNFVFTPQLSWGIYAISGIACGWLALFLANLKRRNPLKCAIWELLLLNLLCILWDICTGWNAWSVDFVMPFLCLAVQLFIFIIAKVKKLPAEEYMIYYLLGGLLGLVPILLVLFQVSNFHIFCLLGGVVSFLRLAALFIFRKKEVLTELHKKLHF